MKALRVISLAALACIVGMGATCTRPAPSPAASTTVGALADQTRADERNIIEDRDSQQMASLQALLGRVPDLREEAWRAELGLMLSRYGKKQPKQADLAEAVARVAAWAEGRVEEARAATAVALANSNDLAVRLAVAEVARVTAESNEAASRAASEKRIKDLEEENRRKDDVILQRTAYGIVGVSLLAILLAGIAVYLAPNKLSALADAAPVIVGGVLGLGLAQLITRPWFMTACGIVGSIIVLGCGWWAYRKNEKGKLAAALAEKAEQTQAVAAKVIPAIDETYDAMTKGAVTSAKEVFDHLLPLLSAKMDKSEKAAVHTIRADLKKSTA
jgi:hypothetical protein